MKKTKKDLVYERYLKKRVLGPLSKSVYLFLSYQKLDIKNFSGIVDHTDGYSCSNKVTASKGRGSKLKKPLLWVWIMPNFSKLLLCYRNVSKILAI